jgi:hypothetical protein|tara:strand:- start:214 stop:558 length:345 start_codon:yes stop_codon:yes gene_type:complete
LKEAIQTGRDIVIHRHEDKSKESKMPPAPISIAEINQNQPLPWIGDKENVGDDAVKSAPSIAQVKVNKNVDLQHNSTSLTVLPDQVKPEIHQEVKTQALAIKESLNIQQLKFPR